MEKELLEKIEAVKRSAKPTNEKPLRTVGRSSLHQIIKTKEQGARFMKLLKAAAQD